MNRRVLLWAALAASMLGAVAGGARAQTTLPAPVGTKIGYALDSGPIQNPGNAARVAYTHVMHVEGAAGLRAHFAQVNLPPGAVLTARSVLDGETQRLDGPDLVMWSNSTAYFNGDTLVLEVLLGPGVRDARLVMEQAEAQFAQGIGRGGAGQCGICSTDDRTPSNEDYSARLMPIGCTASVYCENSTMVSAGHCISGQLVAQFRVPASTTACTTVDPPVNDQFPVTSTMQLNGGVGNDWSVISVGTNGLGERPFQRYGALRRIATTLANVGDACSMFGYGVDLTCTRTQVQQRSTGNITQRLAGSYQFNADVRGGNSGSGLLVNDQIVGVVTHCQTNCPNHGTRVDLASFVAARNSVSQCDSVRVLTIDASAAAVPITVAPADFIGRTNGTTLFTRTYLPGTPVTLTAPGSVGPQQFLRWEVGGVAAPPGTVLHLTLPATGATAAAIYGAACPCDWNNDGALNSQDFFAFLRDFFNINADYNQDGQTNSADFFDFLQCFFALPVPCH